MNYNFEKQKNVIIFSVILTIIFLILIFSYFRLDRYVKKAYFYTIYPIQYSFSKVSDFINNNISSLKKINELRNQITLLEKELENYKKKYSEAYKIREENIELKKQLEYFYDIKKYYNNTVFANVISKNPENFYSFFIINKGQTSGIKKNDAVLTYFNGKRILVGKIIEVNKFASKVITVFDQRSKIAVKTLSSKDIGILSGQAPKYFFAQIDYIDINADLKLNDIVVTSGMGGVFPKDILIGYIIKIDKPNYGLFQSSLVKPYLNYSKIEYVYILTTKKTNE